MQTAAATAPSAIPVYDPHDKYRYGMLESRCKAAEQKLREALGVLAIQKSKQPKPLQREDFIISEIEQANEGLLCESPLSPKPPSASFLGAHVYHV